MRLCCIALTAAGKVSVRTAAHSGSFTKLTVPCAAIIAVLQSVFHAHVQRAAMPALHQCAGHVRTARRAAIRQREDVVDLERNPQRVDGGHHVADALLPDFLKLRDFGEQPGILGIHKVSQNVEFVAVVFRRGDLRGRLHGGTVEPVVLDRLSVAQHGGGECCRPESAGD